MNNNDLINNYIKEELDDRTEYGKGLVPKEDDRTKYGKGLVPDEGVCKTR